jgi:hypothetical protein
VSSRTIRPDAASSRLAYDALPWRRERVSIPPNWQIRRLHPRKLGEESVGHVECFDKLCKALGIYQGAAPVSQSVTLNQVKLGEVRALEAARSIAFILSSVEAGAPHDRRQGRETRAERIKLRRPYGKPLQSSPT